MFLSIDINDRRAIYRQIADGIEALIASGQLREGQSLPAVRQVAADLGVNLNTIAAAYRELQSEGLIVVKRGLGATVASRNKSQQGAKHNQDELRRAPHRPHRTGAGGNAARTDSRPRQRRIAEPAEGDQIVTPPIMNKPWINLAFYIFVIIARFPRIKERWSAPLLRGKDWFFDAAVPPDFWKGPGAGLLRDYRWRLCIPWGIEGAILLALWAASRITPLSLAVLIIAVTLFTRFNYYAARIATENRARAFEPPDAIQPATNVALSLEPRTLWNYTNWWVEAAIALLFGAAAVWMVFTPTPDPLEPGKFIGFLIVSIYIQVGLLLVKLGIVRSSSVAPADNVDQYLAWRDSLRRFAIRMCDLSRVMFALYPLLLLGVITGGSARLAAAIAAGVLFIAVLLYEWRSRLKHLEVARRTRPARFPLLPAARNARGLLGFWPSLPVLLLRTANGYALNLAAAPVRIGSVYFAGFAGLCVWLAH